MSNIDFVSAPADIKLSDYEFDFRTGNPAVYVGTYHKYASGSLFGMWMDLTKFYDYEEFMDACRALHNDEEDPEFMFQDYEGFPEDWYSESSLDEDTFDLIQKYVDLDDDKKDAFEAFMECKSSGRDAEVFEDFEDRYQGEFDSEEDFARYIADECCMLDNVPDNIKQYFDYEAFARDLFMEYTYWNGYVFRD